MAEDRTQSSEVKSRSSLLSYSPAAMLIAVAIIDIQRWADPDLWGHIIFGRAILLHHHIAMHDIYSYSAHWRVWLDHEWLSELLMSAVYRSYGVIGLKLLKFTCSAMVIVFLALALAETDSPPTIQFAILLGAGVAIGPQMQFRPQMFTFVLMSALIAILARYHYRRYAVLWWPVPLLWLWANLHGGFVIGLAMLGIFSIVVLVQDLIEGNGFRRGVVLMAVLLVSILVTLVTPYGIGTWEAVAHATTNPTTRRIIDDWQPLQRALIAMWNRNGAGALPMLISLVMILALVVTVYFTLAYDDLPMLSIAVVMIAAAFVAMRNIPPALIATAVPLARGCGRIFPRPSHPPPSPSLFGQIILAVVGVAILIESGLFSPALRAGSPRPVGAIAFMQEHRLQGNIMTDFDWGEYVIWHMAPASKVFIDGRYDTVYPPEVIDDYLAIHYGGPPASKVLQKYPHDFFLFGPRDATMIAVVERSPAWTRIYRDTNCTLFVRADSEAAQISPIDLGPADTPPSYFP